MFKIFPQLSAAILNLFHQRWIVNRNIISFAERKAPGHWSEDEVKWLKVIDNLFNELLSKDYVRYTFTESLLCIVAEKDHANTTTVSGNMMLFKVIGRTRVFRKCRNKKNKKMDKTSDQKPFQEKRTFDQTFKAQQWTK